MNTQFSFLEGGGEMGERIRNFDWSKTSLGPAETWDNSLKTIVRIILTSAQAMFVWWGNDLINIYNDAYAKFMSGKHPMGLGARAPELWSEIWNDILPRVESVKRNEGTYDESMMLIVERKGYQEELYVSFCYSPVQNEEGLLKGLFCVCTETTENIFNERAQATLRELGAVAFEEKSLNIIYHNVTDALKKNNKDFPFAAVYNINFETGTASPVAYAGLQNDQQVFPSFIDLKNRAEGTHNFYKAYNENKLIISENNFRRRNLPTGFWEKEATHFIHIPVSGAGENHPYAIISAALNPYRKFDDAYRQFCQLIGERVSLEVNKMLALEQETKRAEELAELDKVKTIFFSNISHEFRTPLTLILGNIEEVLNDKNTIPQNIRRMESAQRNSIRLLRLVNTLLDFSSIESGRQQANFMQVNLGSFTRNLSANFRSIAEKAGLQFIVTADEQMPVVYVDKQMWEKIIFNLLSNAFKYTLYGKIAIEVSSQNNFAVLKVNDTGIGISEQELPNMFKRFHRVQNAGGRTIEGTGIGLSLVKELVNIHGGSIAVESMAGKGSTFSVTIPFGKEHLPSLKIKEEADEFNEIFFDAYFEEAALVNEAENKSDEQDTFIALQKMHEARPIVLIVDDNADMRRHIQSLLSKEFIVITAVNGQDALDKIKENHPALVLSDIMMPIMDGLELLKNIKNNQSTLHIPVILLTARAGEESKIEGWDTGADDYLIKPFSGKELIARIKAHITLKQKLQSELKKLYQVFNEVPFAVAVLRGKNLLIEFINQYNLNIWQTKKEYVLEKPLFEARPDLKKSAEHIHQQIYENGERFIAKEIPIQIINEARKEEIRYFDAIIDPIRDESGNITGQIATSIEVTDKVIAQRLIKRNEKELQELMRQAPVAIALYEGENLVCRLANNTALMIMQKTEEEVLNKPMAEFFPEVPERKNIYLEVLHSGTFYEGREVEITFNRSGKPYTGYFDLNYTPWRDANGNVKGVMSIGMEVTDRVNARIKIENSEKELQQLFADAPAGIAILKGEELRYVLANDFYAAFVGRTKDQLIGNTISEIFPELEKEVIEYLKNLYRTGQTSREPEFAVTFDKEQKGNPKKRFFDVTFKPLTNTEGITQQMLAIAYDITEQVETRRKVQESENRFRAVTEATSDVIWTTTADGQLLPPQISWEKYTGQTPDEYKGWGWANMVHPDDREFVGNLWTEAVEKKIFYHSYGRLWSGKHKDWRYYDANAVPIKNEHGEITEWVGVIHDVHEKKMAEEKLQQQTSLLNNVNNNTTELIFMKDLQGHLTYCNRATLEVMGFKEKDVIGSLSNTLYHNFNEVPAIDSNDKYVAQTGETIVVEEVYTNAHNEQKIFLSTKSPLHDESTGKVIGVIGVSRDITERKKYEEVLAASEEKFRSMANNISQLAWMTDDKGWIYWYNQRWYDYTGTTFEEMQGWGWQKVHHPDTVDNVVKKLKQAFNTESYWEDTFPLRSKEGEYRWFLSRAYPIRNTDGSLRGWFGTNTDINEQREYQKNISTIKDQLELTFKNVPAGLYLFDAAGKPLYINQKGAELLGYRSAVEVMNITDAKTIRQNAADKYHVRDEYGNNLSPDQTSNGIAFNTGKTVELITQLVSKETGEVTWLLARSQPLLDETGKIQMLITSSTDITVQKNAEQILVANKNHLELLSNTIPALVFYLDTHCRYVSVNNAFAEWFGINSNEIKGLTVKEFTGDKAWQVIKPHLALAYKGQTVDYQTEIDYRLGGTRWIHPVFTPHRNNEGEVIGVIAFVTDITAQKQAEQKIKQSGQELEKIKQQLELSIHAGRIGLWNWDAKNNVLTWSREQKELYGLSEEDIIQKVEDFHQFLFEEDLNTLLNEIPEDRKITDQQYDFRIRRKDGEVRWIHARSKLIYDDENELNFITGINFDITDQKLAEEKLMKSEYELKELANAMPQLVWIADDKGQVIYYNNRISEFAGISQKADGVWEWEILVHPDDVIATTQQWETSLKTKTAYTKEHRIKLKDGTYKWFLSRGYPQFDEDGNVIKWFGTATDIHEIKIHELRKDDFIKMASHELKTPVSSIKGFTQILLEEYQSADDVFLSQSLTTIDKQVKKLTKLITDLLDITKIETGKLLMNKMPFIINEVIQETIDDLKVVTPKHEMLFYHNEPIYITADRDRIIQVISNLLTNAIKYSPFADKVIIKLQQQQQHAIISVQDFGIGIDKADHYKIFDRFYRAEGKDVETFPGFGIGLFIVDEIIKDHHGTIQLESEKGKGSVFTVSLPVTDEVAE